MYDPLAGRFLQRDPIGTPGFDRSSMPTGQPGPAPTSFLPPDPVDMYPDGMNLYAAYHVLFGETDPSGLLLKVDHYKDYLYFHRLLNQLCPDGNWTGNIWTGEVRPTDPDFCENETNAESDSCGETSHTLNYQNSQHPVSCKCVCDAITANETHTLKSRVSEGGVSIADGRFNHGPVNTTIEIGPPRTGGYPGRDDPQRPADYRVSGPSFITLGHELCGHSVPAINHNVFGVAAAYTVLDPVMVIDEKIREEHNRGFRISPGMDQTLQRTKPDWK